MLTIQPFEQGDIRDPTGKRRDPTLYVAWIKWEGTIWQRSMGRWALRHHFVNDRIPSTVMEAYVLAFIEEMEEKKKKKFPITPEDLVNILLRYV